MKKNRGKKFRDTAPLKWSELPRCTVPLEARQWRKYPIYLLRLSLIWIVCIFFRLTLDFLSEIIFGLIFSRREVLPPIRSPLILESAGMLAAKIRYRQRWACVPGFAFPHSGVPAFLAFWERGHAERQIFYRNAERESIGTLISRSCGEI